LTFLAFLFVFVSFEDQEMLIERFHCDFEVRLSKSRFWKKLAKSLFKERVLYVLLKGQKHRHITNTRQEIKEEQPSVHKEFRFLSFIPSLSVRHSFSFPFLL
jgi:hypothetical protein